jgi:23S rRNA pseudouridine1911/1915/1917 synthase
MKTDHDTRSIAVPAGIDPGRIDKYLGSVTGLDLSRAFIQRMISDGLVTVNGKAVDKNFRLRGGETIVLTMPPPEASDLAPEDIPLEIVYEDEYLAVVNKPAGLVVHPAPGNPNHTLVNALLFHFTRLAQEASPIRPGIIHRLDKDTSGLMMVAKTDPAALKIRTQLAERTITKIYHAVVCGHMPAESGTIDLPIGRSLKDRTKMIVTHLHAREAVTHYKVLTRFRINDLVEIGLETGRTHQIRVHFAHISRPILGDPEYGGRQKWLRGIDPAERKFGALILDHIGRQALHAKALELDHPITGIRLSFASDYPEDFKRLLAFLAETNR